MKFVLSPMPVYKYKDQFPKNYLEVLIYSELGEELLKELDNAGCELVLSEDMECFSFTNITPELQAKVDANQENTLEKYFKFFSHETDELPFTS